MNDQTSRLTILGSECIILHIRSRTVLPLYHTGHPHTVHDPSRQDRDSCQGKWEQRNYLLPSTYIAGVSSKHSKSLTVPPDFQTLRHRKRLKVQFKRISHFYPLDFPCLFLQWEGSNLHPHVFNFHGKKYRCRPLGADPMPTQACR